MPTERQLERIRDEFRVQFQENVPSGTEIAKLEIDRALKRYRGDHARLKKSFSRLVEKVQRAAFNSYILHAGKSRKIFLKVFLPLIPANASREECLRIVSHYFPALDGMFLSMAQSRKARAGRTFELLLKRLFDELGYAADSQPKLKIGKRTIKPDFVMPSRAHFARNKADCIIFTVKRILRERWTQVVQEGSGGGLQFLATIDEDVTANDLDEMNELNVHLVVPQRLKHKISRYRGASNVISYEDFLRFHLDPAVRRWKAHGVLAPAEGSGLKSRG
jgi:hypothetical protein